MRGLRDSAHGGTGIGCHNIASLRSCAQWHRVESGVGAQYGHSPLLVSVG